MQECYLHRRIVIIHIEVMVVLGCTNFHRNPRTIKGPINTLFADDFPLRSVINIIAVNDKVVHSVRY